MAGTNHTAKSRVIIAGIEYLFTKVDYDESPENHQHRNTSQLEPTGATKMGEEWVVNLEWEKVGRMASFDPSQFTSDNLVDVVVVEPEFRIRFGQGHVMSNSADHAVKKVWEGKCSFGNFQSKEFE